jgi:hypothetical protein
LDLSKNDLRSEGLSAVSEALKSTSIKQLNIAENNLTFNQQASTDMSGVIKFAEDMKDMGSLSKLDLSGNDLRVEGLSEIADVLNSTSITQLNLADNRLTHSGRTHIGASMSGVIKFVGVLQDNGSLSSANLLGNSIGVEQAQALLKIKAAKPGLTTLCGLSGDETELDLSGRNFGPGCAILLAPEMEANGSLSKMIFNGGVDSYRAGSRTPIDRIKVLEEEWVDEVGSGPLLPRVAALEEVLLGEANAGPLPARITALETVAAVAAHDV